MPQPFCAMILLLPMGSSSAPFKNMDVSTCFHSNTTYQGEPSSQSKLHVQCSWHENSTWETQYQLHVTAGYKKYVLSHCHY